MTWLDKLFHPPPLLSPPEPDDDEVSREQVMDQIKEGEQLRSAIDRVLIDWEKDFDAIKAQVKITKRERSYEDLWGRSSS